MRKADINFWTDVIIGVAFILSAASGIVFLLPLSGESALGIGFRPGTRCTRGAACWRSAG